MPGTHICIHFLISSSSYNYLFFPVIVTTWMAVLIWFSVCVLNTQTLVLCLLLLSVCAVSSCSCKTPACFQDVTCTPSIPVILLELLKRDHLVEQRNLMASWFFLWGFIFMAFIYYYYWNSTCRWSLVTLCLGPDTFLRSPLSIGYLKPWRQHIKQYRIETQRLVGFSSIIPTTHKFHKHFLTFNLR